MIKNIEILFKIEVLLFLRVFLKASNKFKAWKKAGGPTSTLHLLCFRPGFCPFHPSQTIWKTLKTIETTSKTFLKKPNNFRKRKHLTKNQWKCH